MSLTKEQRDALPDEHFAVPGKRKLPIHDETHTRLAWDMLDKTKGLTPEERSIARSRIRGRAKVLGMDTADWHAEMVIAFQAMAIPMPDVEGHPNKMPFTGVLTRVDQPSDEPPGGSLGKRVFIPGDVAREALPTLLGMAVDCDPDGDFAGHEAKHKIGLITGADVVDDALEIEGFFYANDFPELCQQIKAEKHLLGFSYESKVRIRDLDADIWHVDSCVFTGAAVLYKDRAAYHNTSLAAKAAPENEMTPEQLKALTDSIATLSASVGTITKDIADLKAGRGASLAGPIIDQVKPHVDAANACASAMEAAGIGGHPTKGHAASLRHIANHLAAEAVSGRVPHIYRDHDWFSDARVEAGRGAGESAELKAAREHGEKLEGQLKTVTDSLAAVTTQIKDLQAKAFNSSEAPQRKTLPAEIVSLIAKAGISKDDAEQSKLTLASVDKALEAAGIKGQPAIEAKLKIRAAGLLAAA